MSSPIVTGCALPVFGVNLTPQDGCPPIYFSDEITESCPLDYSGGPFTSPPGKFRSGISQADADAQAVAYLTNLLAQKCVPLIPVVTSGTIFVAPSSAVNYQIVATNSPTSYGATDLPAGLTIDTTTGIISGNVPGTITTYTIPISATNVAGTGVGTLTIKVPGRPRSLLLQNMSFSGNSGEFGGFFVSIDGSTYIAASQNDGFDVFSQLRVKFIFNAGTWATAGVLGLNFIDLSSGAGLISASLTSGSMNLKGQATPGLIAYSVDMDGGGGFDQISTGDPQPFNITTNPLIDTGTGLPLVPPPRIGYFEASLETDIVCVVTEQIVFEGIFNL